jgi:hypothetical protein
MPDPPRGGRRRLSKPFTVAELGAEPDDLLETDSDGRG